MSKSKFADCSEIVSKGLSLSTRINSLSHEVLEISAEEETLTDLVTGYVVAPISVDYTVKR